MKLSGFLGPFDISKAALFASSVLLCAAATAGAQGAGQVTGQPPGQGAEIYAQSCSFCHGADGKDITDRSAGVAIATRPSVVSKSDAELRAVLHDGTAAGMPAFPQFTDEQAQSLVRYLRQLQGLTNNASSASKPAGDETAGKAIFFGKGQCSNCHMINGEGGFIASDMTAYAQNRGAEAVLEAIVNPDTQIAPGSRVVNVVTTNGSRFSGVVRAEDNLQLILQTEDGRYYFLKRGNLASVDYTGHSLMPHDYKTRLTTKELDDVVSFLIASGKNAPADAAPARRRRREN
jgi:cytochrome c oxidase cbb3-type subunit III